jgi:hypothetical protein
MQKLYPKKREAFVCSCQDVRLFDHGDSATPTPPPVQVQIERIPSFVRKVLEIIFIIE